MNVREFLCQYVRGEVIEIGPLHAPFPKPPPPARIRYVDKFDLDELRRRNPDIPPDEIVAPDIIADSHDLAPIGNQTLDSIIASHVLEHLHNPIAALLEWHRVLVPGGRLLCVLPDARFTFDAGRPLTDLDHLLWDFRNSSTLLKRLADLFHIAECNLNMGEEVSVDGAVERAERIMRESYDTHFHVWSLDSFCHQIEVLQAECNLPFLMEEARMGDSEFGVVLRARHDSLFTIRRPIPSAKR